MITITALTFYMIINYSIKFKGHQHIDRSSLINIHQGALQLGGRELMERPMTELQISSHTVMLTCLPKQFSNQRMHDLLAQMFDEMLKNENIEDEEQIVGISVMSDLYNCQRWYKKLSTYIGKYESTCLANQKRDENGDERLKIRQQNGLFGGQELVDAAAHYSQKVQSLKRKIKLEEAK